MPRVAKGIRPTGPPTKKTPETIQRMIETARTGLPLRFVAAAGGVTLQTLGDWRDNDKAFGLAIEQARAESVRERWEEIRKQGIATKNKPGNWPALAWQLERSFPQEFGKPETQVALQFNQQNVTNSVLVITAEEAKKYDERSTRLNKEIDALLEARQAKFDSGGVEPSPPPAAPSARIIEAEAEVVEPLPITLPPEGERTTAWWAQFARGDGKRPVSREAFLYVLRTVAARLRGAPSASQIEVDLGEEQLFVRDLLDSLEELSGSAGWQILLSLGEDE
jgi:hypothetical protein